MNFEKKIIICLLFLCLITIILSVKFIWQKDKWSPIDEYAHMDYIEKMGDGVMPKLHYEISNDIYDDLIQHPSRSFTPAIHNREELGMGNYSYQAKHPPLYYSILVIPNLILKKFGYDIFERLKILRLISYFLFLIGSFLCLPIFKLLNQKGYRIPEYYSWACVLFCLVVITHQRYGLTNNMLSPLLINASFFFILKYHTTKNIKHLFLFLLLSGMSICAALTNVFIVPFLLLYALIIYWPSFSFKTFLSSIFILLIPSLIIVWWKLVTIPNKDFEDFIQNLLLATIPANTISFKIFLDLLLNDSFQLSFINNNLDVSKIYVGLFIINISVCLFFFKTLIKEHIWILLSLCVFTLFVFNLYLLNHYVARVHWVALRNYLGFLPILFISCSAFIVVISKKIFNKN